MTATEAILQGDNRNFGLSAIVNRGVIRTALTACASMLFMSVSLSVAADDKPADNLRAETLLAPEIQTCGADTIKAAFNHKDEMPNYSSVHPRSHWQKIATQQIETQEIAKYGKTQQRVNPRAIATDSNVAGFDVNTGESGYVKSYRGWRQGSRAIGVAAAPVMIIVCEDDYKKNEAVK